MASSAASTPPTYGAASDAASSAAPSEKGKWVVRYFGAPTRGEQVRLLFTLAEQTGAIAADGWIDEHITPFPSGLNKYRRAEAGAETPLMFDQVPSITSPDGVHVSQTAAVMQYAAVALGLAPSSPGDAARALALTLYSEELRGAVFYQLMIPTIVDKIGRRKCGGLLCALTSTVSCCWLRCRGVAKAASAKLVAALPHLEAALREANASDGELFFAGGAASYADVALYDCLRESIAMVNENGPARSTAEWFETNAASSPLLRAWFEQWEGRFATYIEARGEVLACIVDGFIE